MNKFNLACKYAQNYLDRKMLDANDAFFIKIQNPEGFGCLWNGYQFLCYTFERNGKYGIVVIDRDDYCFNEFNLSEIEKNKIIDKLKEDRLYSIYDILNTGLKA